MNADANDTDSFIFHILSNFDLILSCPNFGVLPSWQSDSKIIA